MQYTTDKVLMSLLDNIRKYFTKASANDRQTKADLPFIMLMGTEKTYGKPQPNNYASMVAEYKSWAYACAWKNATSLAKNEICLYRKTYDNKKESRELLEIDEHPLLDLIKRVNPFSNRFELFTITTINLELTGNAYWYIPRGPLGIPVEIWNIPSHWVKIVPSVERFIEGYVVSIPGKPTPIPFDESEIIHFKYPSPTDLFYGQGPLWASRLAVDLGNQMKEWGVNFFLNNAQPSGILTTDFSLSPEQYQRLRDQWNEKHRGTRNAGKMALLENGLKYQQMGSNIRDARFEQVNTEIRDEIMAIFGVPASKLGLESHDNRATAEASDYTYQSETIIPRLTLIQEKLQEKLVPLYDERLILKFKNNVAEDKEYKLKERQINLQSGFSSIDELRIEEGLEPFDLPETKVPLIPFGLNPAGAPKPETDQFGNPTSNNPKEDNQEDDKEDDKKYKKTVKSDDGRWEQFARISHPQEKAMQAMMKRYFQLQHSEVIRKLNNFKGIQKDLVVSVLFNMNEANTDLKNKSKKFIETAYKAGASLGMEETGISFDLFNPNVVRAVENRIGFFAEKTNESTAKLLGKQISEGLANGETLSEIASRVDKVMNYSEDFRSIRTAQTEVIGALNAGLLESFIKAGYKKKKWLTAGDERVRDSHISTEGQVVSITGTFVTGMGSHLQYPGDRSSDAPASDTINCRCRISGVD